jgi:hypothetical protein
MEKSEVKRWIAMENTNIEDTKGAIRIGTEVVQAKDFDALSAQVRELREENERLKSKCGELHATIYGMQDGSLLRDLRKTLDIESEAHHGQCVENFAIRERLAEMEQSLATAREEAALVIQHVRLHSCVSTCCDAQPSAGESKALADCMTQALVAFRALKPTTEAGGGET